MKHSVSSYILRVLLQALPVVLTAFAACSCKSGLPEEEIPVFNQDWNKPMPEVDQDIPVVYITTENNAAITSKEEYVKGHVTISDLKGRYSDVKKLESPMKIRGRGNSTWKYDKSHTG